MRGEGLTPQELGRMAAERAALNMGLLDRHLFRLAIGLWHSQPVRGRCGHERSHPVHLDPPIASGRRARPRRPIERPSGKGSPRAMKPW